jgi:hypothetical protein
VESESIVLFRSATALSEERVLALPFHEMEEMWQGEPLPRPYRWIVAVDDSRLWFAAEMPVKAPPPKHARGEFVEWLAEADDVVELFLMANDTTYQEWHISPDGAWWSMGFVGYRTREPSPVIPAGIEVKVYQKPSSWLGILSIPHAALRGSVEQGSLAQIARMQVTGCVCSRGAVEYISSAGRPAYNPDFHDPRSFRPVLVRPI